MTSIYKALMLEETDGVITSSIEGIGLKDLPEGDVVIAVDYSTLNYKDGLILKGLKWAFIKKFLYSPEVAIERKLDDSII